MFETILGIIITFVVGVWAIGCVIMNEERRRERDDD
jgi:hypothetical protein